jgi:peptidoglycan-associated lipoprotein
MYHFSQWRIETMINNVPLKTLIIGFGLLALVGCNSSPSNTEGTANGADSTAGSGLGDENSFGRTSRNTPCLKEVSNQTYYFDFDKSEVRGEDRACLEVQGRYLSENPKAKIRLEGHTDPRGSREYNIALGERRADAVADVLKLMGVAPSQIRVVSYGAEKLASNGSSDEDYQLDRRVNLVYESK